MFDSETVGERAQILPILTRISGICKEKAVKYGPLSHRCSRIILSPTGCLVAFVDRGDVRRIISLRRANRREVKHYVQSI